MHGLVIPLNQMGQGIQEWTKQIFRKTAFKKIGSDKVCLNRIYHFESFKGCLPQILLGPFLNTLTLLTVGSYNRETLLSVSSLKTVLLKRQSKEHGIY